MIDLLGTDIPHQGIIRDLATIEASYDSADFTYRLEAPDPARLRVGIYVDGELVGRQQPDEIEGSVAGITTGDHTLDVTPMIIGHPLYSRHGNFQGNRVYLKWAPSQSADCAAYKVSRGATLLATITERIVYPMEYHRTSSGGRVSVFGSPANGETINGTLTVTCADGIATFDSLPYTIQRGVTTSLPYGIRITWHDDPHEYADFDIFVGIRSDFTTAPLNAGTHTFNIVALDAAGNLSDVKVRQARVIAIPPAAVVGIDNTVQAHPSIDCVNIYSDYNRTLNAIGDYIETRFPVQVLMPTALPGQSGRIYFDAPDLPIGARFYARPVVGATEREDLVIHTLVDIMAPVLTFGILGDVELSPAAGGDMVISFNYRPQEDGDSAVQFLIEYGTSHDSLTSSATVAFIAGKGATVKAYSLPLDTSASTGTVIFARVTPRAALLESGWPVGEPSETVSAVADADAPVLDGELGAIPT